MRNLPETEWIEAQAPSGIVFYCNAIVLSLHSADETRGRGDSERIDGTRPQTGEYSRR